LGLANAIFLNRLPKEMPERSKNLYRSHDLKDEPRSRNFGFAHANKCASHQML